jgi:membrane protein
LKRLRLPNLEELERRLLRWRPLRLFLYWSKRRSFPGFFKVPIYDVFVFLFNEIGRFDLFIRANAIAYSFFIALFPSLISLFTMLPYLRRYLLQHLPDDAGDFEDILQREIQQIVPGDVGLQISGFIEDLTTNPRVGLLSFGFFLALFFASNGMLALMQGFEKSYEKTFIKRNALYKRGVASLLTILLAFLLLASVILIIMGNFLLTTAGGITGWTSMTEWSVSFLRWLAIISLFYFGISIIYRYGVAVRRKFKIFSPGATLATILCLLTSLGFSFYVDNFGNYNKLYGGFGTIIVTMLWLQLNALGLLIGFELNAAIAINRDIKQSREEEL